MRKLDKQIKHLQTMLNTTEKPDKEADVRIIYGITIKEYVEYEEIDDRKEDLLYSFVAYTEQWKEKLGEKEFQKRYMGKPKKNNTKQTGSLSAAQKRLLQITLQEEEEKRLQNQRNQSWQHREEQTIEIEIESLNV